jgi:hypothetical protein
LAVTGDCLTASCHCVSVSGSLQTNTDRCLNVTGECFGVSGECLNVTGECFGVRGECLHVSGTFFIDGHIILDARSIIFNKMVDMTYFLYTFVALTARKKTYGETHRLLIKILSR